MDGVTTIVSAAIAGGVAAKLIDKISEATGALYEPRRIEKRAEAEAKANLIKAKSDIEISDLQRRALNRFFQEEEKKQENVESIMEKTIPLLNESSKPEEMDDDWIMNFFDNAKRISDEEMQTLWAKILAGEANQPNTFSKRTVNFLASIEKKDAEEFSNLCRFNVIISGDTYPLIYDLKNPIYSNLGIDYAKLTHLDSIGLIRFNKIITTSITETGDVNEIDCSYFDDCFQIILKSKENSPINIGSVMLTQLGLELSKLCKTNKITGFFDYLIGKLNAAQNIEIKMIDASKEIKRQNNSSVSVSDTDTDFVKIYQGVIDGGEF